MPPPIGGGILFCNAKFYKVLLILLTTLFFLKKSPKPC
jgi:hypothetical protein